ncbi:amidohydrolase family protein [Variovorax paradoxus]|jgi:2-pyrone-4,6-dicarboxylate lactonase|uniref:amidohydrolase family protein n=1 Tax=Variovorax paradoxus TaxID=34073 RepID=UPI0029C99A23|nr:amidohydrolase family protein [Variovorax paradoxus]WPH24022.1 amidohydrolase family protein [Variovorax paradoxus]
MTSTLPPGACNAHCHVFGPRTRFPYAEGASFVPEADAPKEALFALNDRLGLQRCVVVQSACHGFDNRATEDAVAARPSSYRGIALLPTHVGDAELRRLDAAGFRGVRFNFMGHLGRHTPIEEVLSLAGRFAPLGWHLQIHGDPALLTDLAPALRRSPTPVVIDHIGRIDASQGLDQPDFRALLGLMAHERFWVKVSGMDRITRQGPPYADAQPFARMLVAEFGDRVVWGNDWPHPNHAGPVPDEQQLVDLIAEMAPSESARHALLVDNPQRLYRFGDQP